MKTLVIRNTKLFFRDRAAVFFSMLSVLIIIAMFALFLGQGNWGGDEIRNSWLMAGVLAVATITVSLGAVELMVSDRAGKLMKGLYASPVKRSHITASYVLSPFIVSVIMTTLTAVAFGVYLIATGGEMLPPLGIVQLLGMILLASITGTALLCLIFSHLKTVASANTVATIIGTLSGFLMGIYMPMGNLPAAMRYVIMLFPPAHAAALFRQILMAQPLADVPLDAALQIEEVLGVVFRVGDFEITPLMSVAYLAVSAVVFFWLAAVRMRKR